MALVKVLAWALAAAGVLVGVLAAVGALVWVQVMEFGRMEDSLALAEAEELEEFDL